MKLGFICPNAQGHLNAMTALARQLQSRGHDVVFLYSSGAGGLPCVSGPDKDHFDAAEFWKASSNPWPAFRWELM